MLKTIVICVIVGCWVGGCRWRRRNIFSSHATKCTYQIGHINQRQDLMVQQWSILIVFLKHLEICSWSCLAKVATALPFFSRQIKRTSWLGERDTAAKNLFFILVDFVKKSESEMKCSEMNSWLPWGRVKQGMRGKWDWCRKWKFCFQFCKNP